MCKGTGPVQRPDTSCFFLLLFNLSLPSAWSHQIGDITSIPRDYWHNHNNIFLDQHHHSCTMILSQFLSEGLHRRFLYILGNSHVVESVPCTAHVSKNLLVAGTTNECQLYLSYVLAHDYGPPDTANSVEYDARC